ncbi:MAG: Rpn family recombination-promoting nuclease/putative transposase, partial [Lachnospiraceae bacterium]|nr:Rpn family recombination-promoting nuclease/putative transposase [Lachnospiraceae bacterium]
QNKVTIVLFCLADCILLEGIGFSPNGCFVYREIFLIQLFILGIRSSVYRKLPECNILFICTFDPFGSGISKYSFKSICMENKDLILEDESSRIFFNCTYKGNDIPHDLKDLYGYIDSGTVKGGLTEMIDNEVVKGRENELWSLEYIREANVLADVREDGREEGREEGRKEGWNNGQKSIVKTMLAKGKTIEDIADLCDLSEDFVREVEKEVAEDTH